MPGTRPSVLPARSSGLLSPSWSRLRGTCRVPPCTQEGPAASAAAPAAEPGRLLWPGPPLWVQLLWSWLPRSRDRRPRARLMGACRCSRTAAAPQVSADVCRAPAGSPLPRQLRPSCPSRCWPDVPRFCPSSISNHRRNVSSPRAPLLGDSAAYGGTWRGTQAATCSLGPGLVGSSDSPRTRRQAQE